MEHPFVSVIIPTKNEEMAIEACLLSLMEQRTEFPYEIIVVDTHSKDKTLEIASQNGVRIITEKRPGKSVARQRGAQEAKGEILCFTEADCRVPDTWIETIAQTLVADLQIIAVTGGYTLTESNRFYSLLVRFFHPISVHVFHALHGHHSLRATNFAVRAQDLKEIGGFNTETMELDDVEFSMRASKYGRIHYVPAMSVLSLDRRFRNRLLRYLMEFAISYYKIAIRREAVTRPVYKDIR